jgi:transcription elongation factor Elf1
MSDGIRTDYTRDIVCPHCGHEDRDSWEVGRGEEGDLGEQECGSCEKPFTAQRHVSITYSSEKLP